MFKTQKTPVDAETVARVLMIPSRNLRTVTGLPVFSKTWKDLLQDIDVLVSPEKDSVYRQDWTASLNSISGSQYSTPGIHDMRDLLDMIRVTYPGLTAPAVQIIAEGFLTRSTGGNIPNLDLGQIIGTVLRPESKMRENMIDFHFETYGSHIRYSQLRNLNTRQLYIVMTKFFSPYNVDRDNFLVHGIRGLASKAKIIQETKENKSFRPHVWDAIYNIPPQYTKYVKDSANIPVQDILYELGGDSRLLGIAMKDSAVGTEKLRRQEIIDIASARRPEVQPLLETMEKDQILVVLE